ncbi:hypothetical protein FSP39_010946 [Pinctada imbricata]|uniref:Protein kinase domain-containing protein n=1 Tax=Pinctada imbricata TaxID=66713 RepID=A0AA89BP14_PINIB|nr:hypothetical protein FSP39_010946 [Pinctada imbricata]
MAGEHEIPIVQWNELQLEEIPIGRGGYGTGVQGDTPSLWNGGLSKPSSTMVSYLKSRHIDVLQQEAQKLRELCQHEGILDLHGLVMERDNYSLILEYMPLGSLTEFRKEFSVQFPLFVRMAKEVVSALAYLHGRDPQVLHLDLKADNILLDKHISAKVSDFGLSEWKTVTMTATRRTDQAQDVRRCTVSHVPPEIWSNINKPSDRFYDIYSFGICVWEMLTGAVPYGNARDDLIRSAVLTGQRPDLTQVPKGCPPVLMTLMTRCWHQKPTKRPAFSDLKKEMDTVYDEEFKRQIVGSLKAIRQEIVTHYPPDDPVNTCTSEIDNLSDTPEEPEPMDESGPSTSQNVKESTTEKGSEDDEMEGENPYLSEGVLMKDESKMDVYEQNLRKILRDPAALRIARTKYISELFPVNKRIKEILNDNEKVKQYIESDTLFRKEIFYPGNNFWVNLCGGHFRMAKHLSQNYTEVYSDDLEGTQRFGRYGRTSWGAQKEDTPRMKRRARIDKMHDEHSLLRDMKKGGSYHRVKKALENPSQVEQLLREQETGESTLKLTAIDPETLQLCQDPKILMSVLQSEWQILEKMTTEYSGLLMKLVAKAKKGNATPMYRDLPMFMQREMMYEDMDMMDPDELMMMREMEMRRRRHHMTGDDDDDDFMKSMAIRRQMMKEMRPRRMESSKKMSKMMKSSHEKPVSLSRTAADSTSSEKSSTSSGPSSTMSSTQLAGTSSGNVTPASTGSQSSSDGTGKAKDKHKAKRQGDNSQGKKEDTDSSKCAHQ